MHTNKQRYEFASDNTAGMCPEALEAINHANVGSCNAYGGDAWSDAAANHIKQLFDTDCQVFFVFNGTAANALAVSALCQPYHAIICHEFAHIDNDECNAPVFLSGGAKQIAFTGNNGKLSCTDIQRVSQRRNDVHSPKVRALSITQSTEAGTVYSVTEIEKLAATAKALDLWVHMDGARFANACASLNCSPAALTWQAGVDVLSFGGTKMGMGIGDALVFFNSQLAQEFAYRRKQAGQLASKMRFLTAPWIGMLQNDVWLQHARHANQMAQQLAQGLCSLPNVEQLFPVDANAVFVKLPPTLAHGLRDSGWVLHSILDREDARFVCSWATCQQDIEDLLNDARQFV